MKGTIFFWWSEIPYLPLLGFCSTVMSLWYMRLTLHASRMLGVFLVHCQKIFPLIILQCMALHGSQKEKAALLKEIKVWRGLECTQLMYQT